MAGGSNFERKNILVTGGAGFIGSHLCDRLIKDANVICVDNFITSSVANIDHLLREPHFEFINHDITQPLDLSRYHELERFKLPYQGVQEIYHLACPISKRHFDDYKIATVLTNSIGVKHVLDLAVANHAKVLYASSGVLYGHRGEETRRTVKETDECRLDHLTTRGAYDEGKRFSEAILQTYADVYGLDVKIARIFRTYGPRMKIFDGNLIPDMVLNALDGKDILISGDEETMVSLAFVQDIVDGIIRLMQSPIEITVVNLGSDQEVRLVNVAQKILQITGSDSRVRFEPHVHQYIDPGLPDTSRAKDLLGWIPLVRLDDGLKRMVDYANSNKNLVTF
ncbi:MAG TPA: GDP-mannose 4,6-dehydratase [bacterium]|nr:MAG: UDP-glucose 4-epimerase [Parcubacteria group bacterium ADurb.Bin192]HPN15459.1 GDP-mannose 4,6-dehydratase [bacterium]